MSIRNVLLLSSLLGAAILAMVDAAPAAASLTCVTGGTPSAGNPCWTEYGGSSTNEYPFGYDGNPVDPDAPYCESAVPDPCYLNVTSFAFRAWNRGLAAMSTGAAYGVWRYNGIRWYPDPTFPGSSTCPGSTILWAGKLDAWLIGGEDLSGTWQRLCRFDGENDEWEPLSVPAATIAEAGPTGVLDAGACFAWNNCWFFGGAPGGAGGDGVVVHWDGQTLSNVTVGIGGSGGFGLSPWLATDYTDAIATTDANGNPFAVAVAAAGTPAEPDGSPSPQVFTSTGRGFTGASLMPPAGTDLDAVAFDSQGDGWIAGNPHGSTGPAPLLPVSSSGLAPPCPGTPANYFSGSISTTVPSYAWTSIGVEPGGDAVAGGTVTIPGEPSQPVVAQVSCSQAPQTVSLGVPESQVTAIAASAVNDVWAATDPTGYPLYAPPQLYQLTDGQTPDAPAGNDVETRPVASTSGPTIFEFAPPVVVSVPPPPTVSYMRKKAVVKKVKLKPALYDIAKPKTAPAGHGTYTLSISFRVRRRITIGLEAIRRGKVVSRSGMKTFTGSHGTLAVTLTPKAWPTGLKFVEPKHK